MQDDDGERRVPTSNSSLRLSRRVSSSSVPIHQFICLLFLNFGDFKEFVGSEQVHGAGR